MSHPSLTRLIYQHLPVNSRLVPTRWLLTAGCTTHERPAMSAPDLEKKQRSSSSSDPELANNYNEAYVEPQEETLHRGLKARQVSRTYTFHSLNLYLNRYP